LPASKKPATAPDKEACRRRGKNVSLWPGRALISRWMIFRPFLCILLVVAFASCQSPYKKKDEDAKKPMQDQSGDQSFQSFLGRLRIAVKKQDQAVLTSLMMPDFGYRWDAAPPGESVFQYWSMNDLWPILDGIVDQKFVPNGVYMVSPPQVVTDASYHGYRAGLRLLRGSWRFAYFVPGEGAPQ
jgi:hypothetical protein